MEGFVGGLTQEVDRLPDGRVRLCLIHMRHQITTPLPRSVTELSPEALIVTDLGF